MPRVTMDLGVPAGFRLTTIVRSHGWYDLPPFHWDKLTNVLEAAGWIGAEPVAFSLTQPSARKIRIDADLRGRWSAPKKLRLETLVGQMLGLQLNVEEFFILSGEEYQWAQAIGAGRMLRSASVYEDAVKMLATTNCSWSLTRQMIGRLVEAAGVSTPKGPQSFPTPQRMAELPLSFYETTMRAGYRSRYFKDFAVQVAEGEIDPESWATFPGSTADLNKQMRTIRGFGRYTVENLCKLLGRYDGLGLDSWCLGKYPKLFGPVRGDVAKAIQRRYARFGCWQGLALWLDLTRDWHDGHADGDFSL